MARGAVASVSEPGAGALNFSASIAGAPELVLEGQTFTTCAAFPPAVVFVSFTPPITAKAGDTFDAVVTISADDHSFPTGTVNVHAEVGAPSVTVDRPAVDFGDVPVGEVQPLEMLVFSNRSSETVVVASPPPDPPFDYVRPDIAIAPGATEIRYLTVLNKTPGDFASVSVWQTRPQSILELPAGCGVTLSVPVHARVVTPDASADARAVD
jgi:hypothetical protein